MRGYSESQVFSSREVRLRAEAESIVHRVSDPNEDLRCHELARIVGRLLGLKVVDGAYGCVEHSWCKLEPGTDSPYEAAHVLDVYCVGRVPMVQIVCLSPSLPHLVYEPGKMRRDIDKDLVTRWVKALR